MSITQQPATHTETWVPTPTQLVAFAALVFGLAAASLYVYVTYSPTWYMLFGAGPAVSWLLCAALVDWLEGHGGVRRLRPPGG